MAQTGTRYPFGLTPVANYEEVCHRYNEAISELAKEYPLPEALPARHPVLAQLEGRYSIQDQLPFWWLKCIDVIAQACPCLGPLLRAVSLQEFRRGSIEQQRWREWHNSVCQRSGERHKADACWYHQGPGLYKIMAEVLSTDNRALWLERFVRRGEKEMPADLDLVITSYPSWWLNMGNGRRWYSCIGAGPDRDPRTIGNWYDTGVLLAALVPRSADCWTPACLIARTTLRLVLEELSSAENDLDVHVGGVDEHVPMQSQWVERVVIGRVYHNDLTVACNLLAALVEHFEQHGLYWGCITGTNTAQFAYDRMFGKLLLERAQHQTLGQAYWLPKGVQRPIMEGQVDCIECEEPDGGSRWIYPAIWAHACHSSAPTQTARSQNNIRS